MKKLLGSIKNRKGITISVSDTGMTCADCKRQVQIRAPKLVTSTAMEAMVAVP